MLGVGLFVIWVGYSLAYYGVDQVRHGNNGLLDLMIPGRYKNVPADSSAPAPVASSAGPPGQGGAVATKGNPSGTAIIFPTARPAGAPAGSYGVDQDGNIYVKKGGTWQVYVSATGPQGVGGTINGKPTPYGA